MRHRIPMKAQRAVASVLATVVASGLVASAAWAADLEARLDRQRVALGETVELQLRLRDGDRAPDIAPLETDFAVLDVRRSRRTQIVNGRRDDSVDWQLTLAPLRTGRLEIPPLHAGSASSASLPLEVLEAGSLAAREAGPDAAPPVLLEAEIDEENPYVQGKVGLTLRVLMDDRVLSGSLSEPSADGAAVERTGEDRHYRETRDGRSYQVVERRYAIFPQRSGELRIPPVVFDGRVRSDPPRSRRADPFASAFGDSFFDDSFFDDIRAGLPSFGGGLFEELLGGGGRPLRTASAPLRVDVKPRPEAAGDGWWLPARQVELVEQWDEAPLVFRVGEPVDRSIAIRATGLSGAQLPALELPPIAGMKQYREPAIDETTSVGDELVSIKLQKAALVPTRPGSVTLPAIELDWWDTEHDRARKAVLPERTVEVLPAAGGAPADPAVSQPSPSSPPTAEAPSSARSASGDGLGDLRRVLPWAGLGALLLGGTLLLVWVGRVWRARRRRTGSPAAAASTPPLLSAREAEARLRAACERDDAAGVLSALREIGRIRWPGSPPAGAAGWGARAGSTRLEQEIAGAERARYAPGTGGFSGDVLWQAYRAATAESAPRRSPGVVLPELYPTLEPKSG